MANPENVLDKLNSEHEALSQRVKTLAEKHVNLMTKEEVGAELKGITSQLDAYGPQLKALQDAKEEIEKALAENTAETARLRDALAEADAKSKSKSKSHPLDEFIFAKTLSQDEGFKHFIEYVEKGDKTQRFRLEKGKGNFWSSLYSQLKTLRGAAFTKAIGDIDLNAFSDRPTYNVDVSLLPEHLPVHRQLIPATTAAPNAMIVYDPREKERHSLITALGAAISGNPSTLTVANPNGLLANDANGFSQITVADGSNSETKTVTGIAGNVLTVDSAFSNDYAVADTKVTAETYTYTDEGLVKPQSQVLFEDAKAYMVALAEIYKISRQRLRNIEGLPALLEQLAREALARVEARNMYFGPGGSNGGMRGLFGTNSQVPTFTALSAAGNGVTAFDYLIKAFYYHWRVNKTKATDALVSIQYHELLQLTKGTDGRYLYFVAPENGGPDMVRVMGIYGDGLLSSSQSMIADWSKAFKIYDGQSVTLESWMPGDDFERNMMSYRAEEFVALQHLQPTAALRLNADALPPLASEA